MSRFFRRDSSDSEDSSSDDNQSDIDDFDLATVKKAAGGAAVGGKRAMFLRRDNDSSDSDSDSDDSNDDDSDDDDDVPKKPSASALFGRQSDSEEDDEEGGGKRLKSARDKRFEEMRAFCKTLQNGKKINDWVAIQNEFDKLVAAYTKFTANKNEPHQRFFIRTCVEIEDFVKTFSENKDAVKKMNASQAKSFNAMKQKIKKHNKLINDEIQKFLENRVTEEESENELVEEVEIAKPVARSKPVVEEDEEAEGEGDIDGSFTVVGRGKNIDLSPEMLYKSLKELLDSRGKKSTDKLALVETLKLLLEHSTVNDFQRLKVLLSLIPAQFDHTPSSGYMSVESWRSLAGNVNKALAIFESVPNFILIDHLNDDTPETELEKQALEGNKVYFHGNLASFVDRLDDEFTKALQNLDPHATEYIDRLKDETIIYGLIVRTQKYYEKTHGPKNELLGPILMKRVEHLYYKPDAVVKIAEDAVRSLYPTLSGLEPMEDLLNGLCLRLYNTNNDRIRTRTLLCHAYYHALHDRFHKARDMLLMSHLQETIQVTDISTQILFNRTMVQIGLCAFRCGMIKEAHNALSEISSSGKVKELLAQGFQRYGDKSPEQEKLEKQRQLPFHMHINFELLECVYLTCSMLLEVPNMAVNAYDSRRKVISKPFRRMLDYHERQVFIGPPENTRDHIMAASKALAKGEWEKCRDLIYAIKIWDLIPNAQKIKEMLGRKIQEEGLRTYFFTYSKFYDSLGIVQLSSMFSLPVSAVYSITAKMIISEELHASLDQPTQTVVLHRPGPGIEMSRLEYLASTYADKVQSFVESNERLLETRSITLGLQNQGGEKVDKEKSGGGGTGGGARKFDAKKQKGGSGNASRGRR
ncbi:Translation initiation factor 3 subunit c [Nowakowskiella sp. JEL0407]|nr:Translation initiation factor 3 subunit c [Nowakowskiella sp. JEL0407]